MACARRTQTWSIPTFSPSSRAELARCEDRSARLGTRPLTLRRRRTMKIVVIGGTGLIGSKTLALLRQGGHEGVAASPNTGVHSITGEGPQKALAGTPGGVDPPHFPPF